MIRLFCFDCPAVVTYFDGVENVSYCSLGTSEEEAYHETTDTWSCKRSCKSVEKGLKRIDEIERKIIDQLIGGDFDE